jgi:hypothetical protein
MFARQWGEADGTSLSFVSSDEDGGDQANIAASGASNLTERDARAKLEQTAGLPPDCGRPAVLISR